MQQPNIKPKYQVKALEGNVERVLTRYTDNGFVHETVEEPAGFMVYFPSGASMRARSVEHLRELGIDLHSIPELVDMDTGESVAVPQPVDLEQVVAASTRGKRRSMKVEDKQNA